MYRSFSAVGNITTITTITTRAACPALSDEQAAVYDAVLANLDRSQVQTVCGYAGCGKTVLVSALAEALPGFAVCAFTGKAAHVLRKKGVDGAQTIHSLIYKPTMPDLTEARAELKRLEEALAEGKATADQVRTAEKRLRDLAGQPAFRLREGREMRTAEGEEVEGLLVDEASMVSRAIHRDLLSFGLPVVFVGDHGQLPPVGDDVGLMRDPDYRLETIHRNAGPVAHFAEHLRKGGHPRRWYCGGEAVRVISQGAVTGGMLLEADQIICGFNNTRVSLNRKIRDLLGRTELLEAGDRVICLRNDREAGLFNGMQGVVTRVDLDRAVMDFTDDDGRPFEGVEYDPQQFGKPKYVFDGDAPHPFDYSHAITCHKAQGSEWGHVLVVEQHCAWWEHQRWAYTAASRARERLTWVA
jgi:exodeoxyribonuclease-5